MRFAFLPTRQLLSATHVHTERLSGNINNSILPICCCYELRFERSLCFRYVGQAKRDTLLEVWGHENLVGCIPKHVDQVKC